MENIAVCQLLIPAQRNDFVFPGRFFVISPSVEPVSGFLQQYSSGDGYHCTAGMDEAKKWIDSEFQPSTLSREKDPSYWYKLPEAPKAKLANEKPKGITVDYDELVKSWADAAVK